MVNTRGFRAYSSRADDLQYRGRGVKGALSPGAHTLVHLDGENGPLFSLVGLGEGAYGFKAVLLFEKVPGEVVATKVRYLGSNRLTCTGCRWAPYTLKVTHRPSWLTMMHESR